MKKIGSLGAITLSPLVTQCSTRGLQGVPQTFNLRATENHTGENMATISAKIEFSFYIHFHSTAEEDHFGNWTQGVNLFSFIVSK